MTPDELASRNAHNEQIAERLSAPFDSTEIKFKPQTVAGNRALALPYVDARVIQDRLDDVLGVMNWQDSYEVLADGSVVCRLMIRLGEEWITKEDVGGESDQPDEGDRRKAAFSDALKRAAVKYGLGRYLYRQKPQWVDYDPQKKQFVRQPQLPAEPLASDPDRRMIQTELERTGETPERLWVKLKLPRGSKLTASQARTALGILAAIPDAQKTEGVT